MENNKELRLFGFVVYRRERGILSDSKTFLGGFFSEIKGLSHAGGVKKVFLLFGIPLFKSELRVNKLRSFYLLGLRICSFSVESEVAKELEQVTKGVPVKTVLGRKNVVVINTNSGEASLMLMFFWDSFLSRCGISSKEEYVVICAKRYLVDMVKFYFPEVRAVQYNSGFMKSRVAFEDAGQWRIHWLFPSTYFRDLEEISIKSPRHFLVWMRDHFGFEISGMRLPDSRMVAKTWASLQRKLSPQLLKSLNDGRLLIFAPEALTMSPLGDGKIKEISDSMNDLGYDVYLNTSNPIDKNYLTFPELWCLASRARGIVGLRSGLLDFLLNTRRPMVVYYTPHVSGRGDGAEWSVSVCSLKKVLQVAKCADNSRRIVEVCVNGSSDKISLSRFSEVFAEN